MATTRREAIRSWLAATCGLSLVGGGAATEGGNSEPFNLRPLDYGRSFICNTATFNSVRLWIESRTRLIDETTGTFTDFYQCGSCKSENTFGEKDLFYADNYDFLPILGEGHWLIFRRTVRLNDRYRSVAPVEKLWGVPKLILHEVHQTRTLETWEEIRDATTEGVPMVTQTELSNPDTRLRAILECPTKTMNVSLDKKMYQVDTGPVALPDLSKRYDPQIESLRLAFVAFNAPHFADFVIEQPTRIQNDGAEDCQTYHYSNPISLTAINRVIALKS